jgi:hypothetical protein
LGNERTRVTHGALLRYFLKYRKSIAAVLVRYFVTSVSSWRVTSLLFEVALPNPGGHGFSLHTIYQEKNTRALKGVCLEKPNS